MFLCIKKVLSANLKQYLAYKYIYLIKENLLNTKKVFLYLTQAHNALCCLFIYNSVSFVTLSSLSINFTSLHFQYKLQYLFYAYNNASC